jgi:hypothetical protein
MLDHILAGHAAKEPQTKLDEAQTMALGGRKRMKLGGGHVGWTGAAARVGVVRYYQNKIILMLYLIEPK